MEFGPAFTLLGRVARTSGEGMNGVHRGSTCGSFDFPRRVGPPSWQMGYLLCFFLPIDPMSGPVEWGSRAIQDDPDSSSRGGRNVFDVYSKSQGTAHDGSAAPNGETTLATLQRFQRVGVPIAGQCTIQSRSVFFGESTQL